MTLILLLWISVFVAVILAFAGDSRFAPELNIAGSIATFSASVALAVDVYLTGSFTAANGFFFIDLFNVFLVVVTTFVSMTTAIFSRRYMRLEREHGKVGHYRMRFYHAMFQMFIFAMLVALLTNNFGVYWISMELATLATVLLVSLYRTPTAIEAAWKYFILCGVGIAQALFGTVLLYFAAERVLGEGGNALLWTNLSTVTSQLEPTVMRLAFVFLMVGYGAKAGLVPVHNWLPDAHSEGPTPISAVLSGLLLNVALYGIVRFKSLVDGSTGTSMAGNMMIGFGLLSLLVAAFSMLRQKDIKRLFAYSSIEHIGIATFAFGLGGKIAVYGAMLHMMVHSLTKSSVFFSVGHAAQMHGTQEMSKIKGLFRGNAPVGWGLMLGGMALAGMPPFGLFTSEFLILTATMQQKPYLAPFLLVSLIVAFAALFRRLQPMAAGVPPKWQHQVVPANIPVFVHLFLVLILGIYLPDFLSRWIEMAVGILK